MALRQPRETSHEGSLTWRVVPQAQVRGEPCWAGRDQAFSRRRLRSHADIDQVFKQLDNFISI